MSQKLLKNLSHLMRKI